MIVNGIVLAEDGKKMAKKLQNYPDPMEVVDKYGADSLRFYLLSTPVVRAEDLNFSEKGVDEVSKKIVSKIRNIISFYEMYKDKIETTDEASENVLDEWILLRLRQAGEMITKELDKYNLDRASRPIELFVDDLSNWFVRRSRDRFKEGGQDAAFAMSTLRYVLEELSKLVAPFMPFVAEEVYQVAKVDGVESVHLESWPKAEGLDDSGNLSLREMLVVRNIVSLTLDKRLQEKIKVRQPLQKIKLNNKKILEVLIVSLEGKDGLLQLIKEEVNVKEVVFDDSVSEMFELDTTLTPELKEEGMVREIVRFVQGLRKKAGLTPDEKIKLTVDVDDQGKSFVEKFEADIKKGTNTDSIKFTEAEDSAELKMEDFVLKFKI